MRLHAPQQRGAFARVAQAIADADAMLGAIDLVRVESREVVRDVTVACVDSGHAEAVVRAVRGLEGVRVHSVSDRTVLMHKGGKIEVNAKLPLKPRDDLSMAYTPGVTRVSIAIHEDPAKARALTIKANTVAVVSEGTAVLRLGAIGPAAAMPVMEGKAMLFKEFAGVDAFPLCIDTKDVDEIVAFVTVAAPTFGGVNLEDISAPRCFEIERRLRAELDVPVSHDDQHGTAIVVLAALLNALRIVGNDRRTSPSWSWSWAQARPAWPARRSCSPRASATWSCATAAARCMPAWTISIPSVPRSLNHQQAWAPRHTRRGAGRRRRAARPLGPRRSVGRRGPRDGCRCDRLRDGQPRARGPAGRGPRRRRDHGHRAL
jgi:hypothetical protein